MLPLEVIKVGTKPLTDLTFNHRVVMHPASDLKYRLRLIAHHTLFKILNGVTSDFNAFYRSLYLIKSLSPLAHQY